MTSNFKKPDGKPGGEPARFGSYNLQELINRGGMAEIWLATNEQGETFALRRMIDNSLFNLRGKKEFLRGCETLKKIHDHSHVIGYFDHGKIEGQLYLLMEYVEGFNLRQILTRHDDSLSEHVAGLLIDMAVAIEHVHDSGFMHLDFKPENVLVTRNATVRLVDFDLALPKPDKPIRLSTNSGTPAYMAPEHLRKEPLDHRADIFAYGVTAYELLTSKPPFIGDTPEEVLRRQLDHDHDIVPPRHHNPEIPAAVEKIILKCLERDAENRYPFMSILVRDLEAALYVP